MTKHYCDICGTPLDDTKCYRLTYKYVFHDAALEYASGKKDVDLCQKCFDIFEITLKAENREKGE